MELFKLGRNPKCDQILYAHKPYFSCRITHPHTQTYTRTHTQTHTRISYNMGKKNIDLLDIYALA